MNTFKIVIETLSILRLISEDYIEDPSPKAKTLKKLLNKQKINKKALILQKN